MAMDGLMEKLAEMDADLTEKLTNKRDIYYASAGILKGVRIVMELVQQHIDHAEEIQAQEDAAARELGDEIAPVVFIGYDPDGDGVADGHGYLCRDANGTHYLSNVTWHETAVAREREAFPHPDPAGEPEDPDAERRNTPEYRHGELSFEQLAEDAHEQVGELLRRSQNVNGDLGDGLFQCALEHAARTLEIAMNVEEKSSNDFPHPDPDGEPGVGVPS